MYDSNTIIILHNIRSAHNVGSIFRTADAVGVKKIYLTGYTPTPIDRFGRVQNTIAKTALGAHMSVSWKHYSNIGSLLKTLKRSGYKCVAVEQSPKAVDYRKIKNSRKVVFIFGNEVRGLSKQVLKICGNVIEIPMHGKKESLNVSVAAGIVLFQIV